MSNSLVSIGLPVYNGMPYVENAILSLLHQTYNNFELVICDNNSTDETWDICQKYAQKDSRIRLYRNNQTIGVMDNFLRVLELTSGEFFMWAAHDDIWYPNYVSRCLDALKLNEKAILCFCQSELVNHVSGTTSLDTVCTNLLTDNTKQQASNLLNSNCPTPNAIYGLFKRHYLVDIIQKIRNRLYVYGGDRVLLLQVTLSGKIVFLEDVLRIYNYYYGDRISDQNTYMRYVVKSLKNSNILIDFIWEFQLGKSLLVWQWYFELFYALLGVVWSSSATVRAKIELSYNVVQFMNKRKWPIALNSSISNACQKLSRILSRLLL